ncbi:hypothetical protein [Achromobacter sp. DH1f]|uniref:hypothetical protein n=1 Tax=Achromobacter sp. DH1f TaxID=1397275 RepID=UPI0004692FC5|nr:hypothetical protein [Achromobacter sp. DH1f]
MQTFKDTETGRLWLFEDDVIVDSTMGPLVFRSPTGATLQTPSTLIPAELPAMGTHVEAVPSSVSRYQGREAMRMMRFPKADVPNWTLFDAFEALLADSTTPAYYRRAWDELQVFERSSAMLNAAADVLGLSPSRRDDLFRLAASIKA